MGLVKKNGGDRERPPKFHGLSRKKDPWPVKHHTRIRVHGAARFADIRMKFSCQQKVGKKIEIHYRLVI